MGQSAETIGPLGSEGNSQRSKRPIEQEDQRAKLALHFFLAENYGAITAMRSYSQHLRVFEKENRLEELREIAKAIEERSQGKLHSSNGHLCEIGAEGAEHQYHSEDFPVFGGNGMGSVRGFSFDCSIEDVAFECVILDAGGSSWYYELKDSEEKKSFIKSFAERKDKDRSTGIGGNPSWWRTTYVNDRDGIIATIPHASPWGFTAFLRDDGRELTIDGICAYGSFPPRLQK